ncbi:tripartite tricarboxylate transporter TctB family protein, partial [Pantanalinema rosaneae CENA516]|uniref:tripartite tricarboxylate transporter TctB family protein n=1 Tax=Pantanalinema rosaneae TaxID=1620701 RepID=UPI003D6E96C2
DVYKRQIPDMRARLPQAAFTALLAGAVIFAAYDASQATRLARMFPLTVALITLALILPLLWTQLFVAKPRTGVFTDTEFSTETTHGNLHYILWMLGLLGLISVVGFPVGGAIFVMLLTTFKVGGPWWRNALVALGTITLLLVLAKALNLYYPPSLLSPYLPQGWG